MTAMLFSAAVAGEGLSQEACQHTLPIFDSHQRYDLSASPRRSLPGAQALFPVWRDRVIASPA